MRCAAITRRCRSRRSAGTPPISSTTTGSTTGWGSVRRSARSTGSDGKVLLLGCGYDTNTSLHLAECRQATPPHTEFGSSVRRPDGTAEWITWTDVETREDDFEDVGTAFEAAGGAVIGPVGEATARLMSQRALVDFATAWFAGHRTR